MDLNLRQLGAHLHTLMYAMFSQVPSENIGKMRLFKLADLPLYVAGGPVMMGQMLGWLGTFQHNLSEHEWPSLAEIYPRPMMWFYAYNLFFWSRYCNALPLVLSQPDRSLPAEIYLRFICQIDTYLDSFDSRGLRDHLVEQIELQPGIQAIRADLNCRLKNSCKNGQNGNHPQKLINTYLDHNLHNFRRWMASENMTLDEIRIFKEITTGELNTNWSLILSSLYDVPDDLAENAAKLIYLYSMATQVVDDISDAKQDYLVHSPNILLGMARENSGEYERLVSHIEKTKNKYLHWPWVKKNAPSSYAQAIEWIHLYVEEIKAVTQQKSLTDELISLIARLITITGYENIRF